MVDGASLVLCSVNVCVASGHVIVWAVCLLTSVSQFPVCAQLSSSTACTGVGHIMTLASALDLIQAREI